MCSIPELRSATHALNRINSCCLTSPVILDPMESASQTSVPVSDPELSGFAGFLAALASPQSRKTQWNDEALADDTATISYESALKAHARWRPPVEPPVEPTTGARDTGEKNLNRAASVVSQPKACNRAEAEPKTASITIRMSQAECEQLRRRAAQAGLTISSYLRSCTFEAESLRAQVKQALMQLRSGVPAADPVPPAPPRVSWFRRLVNR